MKMAEIKTIYKGESVTLLFTFPEAYDMARLASHKVFVGETEFAGVKDGQTIKMQLKSSDTDHMIGTNKVVLLIDDAILGLRKPYCCELVVAKTQASGSTSSVSNISDIIIPIVISETAITVGDVMYNYVKGDKGDPFLYSDFTPEQIAELQQPAADTIASVQAVELAVEQAEVLRVTAEQDRQTNTATAIQNAENATQGAGNAASLANTKAGLANDAAALANTKAGLADTAATNANTKAGLADTAATNANNVANTYATELAAKELKANKQNSLTADGTGTKFPTVDAVNAGLVAKTAIKQVTGASETDVMSQKAVSDIVDTNISTTWELANDTFPVENGYGAKGIGQYTKKMVQPTTFSAVKVNQIKTATNIGNYDVLYRIYKVARTSGYLGERDAPMYGIIPTDVLLSSGTITINNTYSSPVIPLNKIVTLQAGEQVLIYVGQQVFTTNLVINGTNGPTYLGNADKTSNAVLYYLDGTTPFTSQWYVGSVYIETNKGFFARALTLIKQPLFATNEYVDEAENVIKEYVDSSIDNEKDKIEISLPDKIYAVVGDTLQLFYRGIIKAVNPYNYYILINCTKGQQYQRYFNYLPTVADIGTTNFKITVKGQNGIILATKTVSLITKAAPVAPATNKNIICIGDSLTYGGTWCAEADRRLTGTGGTPAGKALANLKFCGKYTNGTTGYFGFGGWTWNNYVTAGANWYKVTVTGQISINAYSIYKDSDNVSFTIREVNMVGGTGYITVEGSASPVGTLTFISGSGDATIAVGTVTMDEANPFWTNGQLDFVDYANTYCNGTIDVIYALLSWNGMTSNKTSFTSECANIRTFMDKLHTQFPNAKMKIMGVQVPSQNGGMGANYGASGVDYSDMYGMTVSALNMNKAYQDLANEAAYSSWVEFVNVSSQFDSENNMPEADAVVNTRSTKTEKRGTNGVHPATEGYYQIADVVYRNIVANFCQ